MSILLNALNKNRKDDNVDDIDVLLESPIDELKTEDVQPKAQGWLFYLLISIVILLVILVALLVWKVFFDSTFTQSDNASNHNRVQSTTLIPAQQSYQEDNLRAEKTKEENDRYFKTYDRNNNPRQLTLSDKPKRVQTNKSTNSGNTNKQNTLVTTTKENALSPTKKEPSSHKKQNESVEENIAGSTQDSTINGDIISIEKLSGSDKLDALGVKVDAHVYSEKAESRFIFVEGKLKQEGDDLSNGWVLKSIEEKAIVIQKNQLIVRKEVTQ